MTTASLPTGTVTFLFTDIEGSTRLVQSLGDRWLPLLETHNQLLREAIRGEGGIDLRTEGDAFFAVFESAPASVAAAVAAQRALAEHRWPAEAPIRVRMGMHTGEGAVGGDDYVGLDVHRAARIAAAGHGGQVLVSSTTAGLVEDALPDGVTVRDLGAYRLKDLARPERILQVTIDGHPDAFPPIRSLEPPTNLPAPRTSFVGRDREVDRVKELLRGPGLLTLTGPGGSGKTRLALEAARTLLDDYPDGVFLAELGPISNPVLVAATIADAVGLRAEGGRPALDTLREQLADREMLIVLDNFEQVLDGAPAVGDLLDAAPRLRLLATSREPLHVAGENELSVPPLALPAAGTTAAPEELMTSEAVTLFVQRAMAVDPAFRLSEDNAAAVGEVCRRLDGLPLAIELAASRVKLLSPQTILERLERRLELLTGGPVDLPPRQRTLRQAIDWSHDLLDEPERALFRRLSVFAGGWTLDAAEAVAGDDPVGNALDVLASLVDKSLVTSATTATSSERFAMLETIREFGREQLLESGENEAVRDRHAERFLSLAERAEPKLRAADQKRWLDELEEEHDNIRGALRWAIDAGRTEVALRFVGALWRFWHLHGHLAEGRSWAEEVLALPQAVGRTAERSKALTALGGVAYWQEDMADAERAYEEALAIARELGDGPAEAEGLYNLAYPPAYRDDMNAAVDLIRQARERFESLGMERGVADTIWLQAILARLEGDTALSRALAEESLERHRKAGDRFGTSDALHVVGRVALAQGDLEAAGACFLEALAYDEEVENRTGMGIVLDNLAARASAEGRHLPAVRLAGASEATKEAAGGHAPPPFIDLPDPRDPAREALGDAAVDAAWEEGRAMTLEQAVAYAREVG